MKDLLEPAFQPIVDLATGEVAHYEALARIKRDPMDSGHGSLIQLAERHHFIHLVDLAMLDLAAEAATREGQRIATNFSVLTIEANLHQVITQLSKLGAVRDGLVAEITETVPVRDRRKVAYFIDAVREMGCRVALDDFGNGCGHFTEDLIRFLRPDFIKLDGAILGRAARSGDHRGLEHVTALARNVGAQIIAEFVDSDEKQELLGRFGVRYAQGWAVGRPVRNEFRPAIVAGGQNVRRDCRECGNISSAHARKEQDRAHC